METNQKKSLFIKFGLGILIVILLGIIGCFSYEFYQQKIVEKINTLSLKEVKTLDECKLLLSSDEKKIAENKYFQVQSYEKSLGYCKKSYDLESVELDDFGCNPFISQPNQYFKDNYTFLDTLMKKREFCLSQNFLPKFSMSGYFSIYNNFKSRLVLEDSWKFYSILRITPETNENYATYQKEARDLLKKLLVFSPNVEIKNEDIHFRGDKIFIDLSLKPETNYTLSYVGIEDDKKKTIQEFSFTTPENKYFGMRVVNPVTLYTSEHLPKFEVLDFASDKNGTKVKICRIDEENYARLEVFEKTKNKAEAKKFFTEHLEKFNDDCEEKEINITEKKADTLGKVAFDFDEYLSARKGLFFVSFVDKEHIEYNGKINYPVFFGKADSDIMMKVSRNGQGFFFVNDLKTGQPLANQEIFVYLNDFVEVENNYFNREKKYNFPLHENVLSKAVSVGFTDEKGILRVNLQEKLKDSDYHIFTRTDGYEDSNGKYATFFVKSVGENHISYLTSTWNGGIEPWNFGYGDWSSEEKIQLGYELIDDSFNGHIYTDRVLYLPGEKVNFRGIIRVTKDLSIPENQKLNLSIRTPSWNTLMEKEVTLNEFGSFTESVELPKDAENGYYGISLYYKDHYIANATFSVETFQKPKIDTEISLETKGLDGEFVKIEKTEDSENNFGEKIYFGKFQIQASVLAKYYSGGAVSEKKFDYKVFRQKYYADSYWEDCFYGCFWSAPREFYTSGTGILNKAGKADFDINVDFSSNYNDYKYIVEVSIPDDSGEVNTTSNSVLAKLSDALKLYNPSLEFNFSTSTRFVEKGKTFVISGQLQKGTWSSAYNDNYMLVIKRKDYINKKVTDVNGFERILTSPQEFLEDIILVNNKNFSVNKKGQLELKYKTSKSGEYVFEYGPINKNILAKYLKIKDPAQLGLKNIQPIFDKFIENPDLSISYTSTGLNCIEWKKEKITEEDKNLDATMGMREGDKNEMVDKCVDNKITTYLGDFTLDSLISGEAKYFSVISYGGTENAANPVLDDNKLLVLSDKVVYKIGETARILVRLPVSKSKILVTTEKNDVKNSELIDVEGNIFFKEFVVDESFEPNAYIGIFMIDLENKLPEYKVGYTEIVIDKSDKKADIEMKTDREIYSPRDKVAIDMDVKDSKGKPVEGEVTVMVVDDSLISLMGNINTNTLEFIYQKLPFITQTAMSNIAMLRNYYFSRQGQVGGSGFADLKGGDSAVSTRNIFKNTAYFGTAIIDKDGKAQVKFELPDNLTSFRVMALVNSKENFFGYKEQFIKVRKAVIVQDKTPLIFRDGDISEIGAMVTNNTKENLSLTIQLKTEELGKKQDDQTLSLAPEETKYISWKIDLSNFNQKDLHYSITALGNNTNFSDRIEKKITVEQNPILITNFQKLAIFDKKTPLELEMEIPENTDLEKTMVELSFANNRIIGVENILHSLDRDSYFYSADDYIGIIDKNLILEKFSKYLKDYYNKEDSEKDLNSALIGIQQFKNADGGFAYYEGWSSDYYLTNLVVKSLLDAEEMGKNVDRADIENATRYLEYIYNDEADNVSDNTKAEIYFTLKRVGKNPEINFDYTKINRYALINFTYGLLQNKGKNTDIINANIKIIQKSFQEKIDRKDFYSWDKYLEKALFTLLLYDLGNAKYTEVAENYISELYEQDWTNNYFSNETRNRALDAFAMYLSKNYKNNYASFGFSVGTHGERGYKNLGQDVHILTYTYKLSDILASDKKSLDLKSIAQTDAPIYVTLSLKQYPQDKTKVKAFANGITLQKEIFEVVDADKILTCQDIPNNKECKNIFKKVEGNNFEQGKTYKTKIVVQSENPDIRNQIILQDYLAATMQVMNSKFLNVSSNFKTDTNWYWQNVQKNANLIQAVTYTSDKELVFEYYFVAGFSGTFVAPPAIIKELYNPDRNANSDYKIMNVSQ